MREKTCLVTILIVSSFVMPILGELQSSQNIESYGTIDYSAGLLYGVCSHPWVLNERDFQEMKTLGVRYVRMDFRWQDFEPTRDAPCDFSMYDQILQWAKGYGLEIVALPLFIPPWLRPVGGDQFTIPTGADFNDFVTQFGDFVYALADHYKGKIVYFEIWNEPNNKYFWNDAEGTLDGPWNRGIAITKYVTLIKEAYTRVKRANTNCKIISGGIGNDVVYLQGMYENGVKGYFDYLGSHPYFWHSRTKNYDPDYVVWEDLGHGYFPKIQLIRDVMVAFGDGNKDVFITELGIGDFEGPEGPTTEEMQADRLKRVFEKIDHDPGYPFVNAVMWYQYKGDNHMYGLLREDYTPRLMYYGYKGMIASNP